MPWLFLRPSPPSLIYTLLAFSQTSLLHYRLSCVIFWQPSCVFGSVSHSFSLPHFVCSHSYLPIMSLSCLSFLPCTPISVSSLCLSLTIPSLSLLSVWHSFISLCILFFCVPLCLALSLFSSLSLLCDSFFAPFADSVMPDCTEHLLYSDMVKRHFYSRAAYYCHHFFLHFSLPHFCLLFYSLCLLKPLSLVAVSPHECGGGHGLCCWPSVCVPGLSWHEHTHVFHTVAYLPSFWWEARLSFPAKPSSLFCLPFSSHCDALPLTSFLDMFLFSHSCYFSNSGRGGVLEWLTFRHWSALLFLLLVRWKIFTALFLWWKLYFWAAFAPFSFISSCFYHVTSYSLFISLPCIL